MARNKIDWEELEKEWRTGQFSNVHLAQKYGISEAAIRKKAKKLEWEKDLSDSYQKEFENQAIKESAKEIEPKECEVEPFKETEKLRDDKETVRKAASVAIDVIRKHKKRIRDLTELHDLLKEKLNLALAEKPDGQGRLPALIGFKSQHESLFDILSKLTGITNNLIKAERQAYSIVDPKEPEGGSLKDKTTEDLIKIINACKSADK